MSRANDSPAWLAAVLWGLLTTASPAVADSPPFPLTPTSGRTSS